MWRWLWLQFGAILGGTKPMEGGGSVEFFFKAALTAIWDAPGEDQADRGRRIRRVLSQEHFWGARRVFSRNGPECNQEHFVGPSGSQASQEL